MNNPDENPLRHWQLAEDFRSSGQSSRAEQEYACLGIWPEWRLPASLRLAQMSIAQGNPRAAQHWSAIAFQARENDPVLQEGLIHVLVDSGHMEMAMTCVEELLNMDRVSPDAHLALARRMRDQGETAAVVALLDRLPPGLQSSAEGQFLVAESAAYLGDMARAEEAFERCIALQPLHAEAHRGLAKLKTWSNATQHVDRLRNALRQLGSQSPSMPLLCYALFKELDDLGDYASAWRALDAGMKGRRAQVSFDESSEERMFDALQNWRGPQPQAIDADGGPKPLFIVGLPRSGTTLLERVLGNHEDVADAGELRDLTFNIRLALGMAGPHYPDAAMIKRLTQYPGNQWAAGYLQSTRWRANGRFHFTDKMPVNFVYVGWILSALPHSSIICMHRNAMDVCFSNLKELFGNAYPHSYHQQEMARHYFRYTKLMNHWKSMFPDKICEVSYERLTLQPAAEVKMVIAHCGIKWNDTLLDMSLRPGSIATASATQVRNPVHTGYLNRWKNYQMYLKPMSDELERLGCLPG